MKKLTLTVPAMAFLLLIPSANAASTQITATQKLEKCDCGYTIEQFIDVDSTQKKHIGTMNILLDFEQHKGKFNNLVEYDAFLRTRKKGATSVNDITHLFQTSAEITNVIDKSVTASKKKKDKEGSSKIS